MYIITPVMWLPVEALPISAARTKIIVRMLDSRVVEHESSPNEGHHCVLHLNNGLVALVPIYLDGSDKLGDETMVLILNQAPGTSLSILVVGVQPEGRFERIGVVTVEFSSRSGMRFRNSDGQYPERVLWRRVIVVDGWIVQRRERSRLGRTWG
jgi:hypothetical protein